MSNNNASIVERILRILTPVWVLALVLALFWLTADPASPIKNLITAWAAVVLAVVWMGGVLFRRANLRFPGPAVGIALGFLAVNAVAAVLSPFPAHSLSALAPWLAPVLIASLAAQVYRKPEHVWRLLGAVVIAAALSSVYGFCQWFGYDPFPWAQTHIEEYRGLPSTYANPNFAGHALLLALIIAGGLILRPYEKAPRLRAALWLAPALLIAAHLDLTHMRGSRVGLAAALALLAIFRAVNRKARRPATAAIASLGLLLLLALAGLGAVFAEVHFSKERVHPAIDGSLVLRANGYYGASRMFLARPVLGFGPGNYALDNAPYWTPFEQRWFALEGKKNTHVHNDLLEAAVDAGTPGALLYAAMLAWAVLASLAWAAAGDKPQRRLGLTLAACFCAFAVDGLFGFNLRVPVSAGLFFLLLGVLDGVTGGPARPWRGRMIPAAVALLLAACAVAVFETQVFRAEMLYQRAQGAQYWARVFKARQEFAREKQAMTDGRVALEAGERLLPWDSRFPWSIGYIDRNRMESERALKSLERAISLDPNNPEILVSLSQTYLNLALTAMNAAPAGQAATLPAFRENLDEAEQHAQAAAALCPALADAQETLGRVAFMRATAAPADHAAAYWAEAEKHFQDALRDGIRTPAAVQRMLAQVYLNTQRPDQVEAYLRRSAESDPSSAETWTLFQSFATNFHRYGALLDALNHNLALTQRRQPPPADAVAAMALLLAENVAKAGEDPALARPAVLDALALDPAQMALWGAYVNLAPPDGAAQALADAVADVQTRLGAGGKKLPPILTEAAAVKAGEPGTIEKAVATLSQSAQQRRMQTTADAVNKEVGWLAAVLLGEVDQAGLSDAARGRVLAGLGAVFASAGRWQEADTTLAQAIPLLPPDVQAQALTFRADALASLGRPADALAQAQEAARLAPNNPAVRWNLARRLAEAGRLAEAKFEYLSLLQAVNKQSPSYQQIASEYAALERRMGSAPTGGTP